MGITCKDKIDSSVIQILRFPLAIMVVALHAQPIIHDYAISWGPTRNYGAEFAGHFVYGMGHVITHLAVPMFFLFSGFLFFKGLEKWDWSIWRGKIKRRLCSLLIPYLLWNTMYIMVYGDMHFSFERYYCSEISRPDELDLWGNPACLSSPFLNPLWYVRELMIAAIISPVFYFFLHKGCKIKVYLSLLILTLVYITSTSLILPGFHQSMLFCFGLGAFLSCNKYNLSGWLGYFSKYKTLILGLSIILTIIDTHFDGEYTLVGKLIFPFFCIVSAFCLINIVAILVSNRNIESGKEGVYNFLEQHSESSFFLYCFHPFILLQINQTGNQLLTFLTGYEDVQSLAFANHYPYLIILIYIINTIFVVTLSVCLYYLIKWCMPSICKVLCGKLEI